MTPQTYPVRLATIPTETGLLTIQATPEGIILTLLSTDMRPRDGDRLSAPHALTLAAILQLAAGLLQKPLDTTPIGP